MHTFLAPAWLACAFLARVLRIARASLDRVLSGTRSASLCSYREGSYKAIFTVEEGSRPTSSEKARTCSRISSGTKKRAELALTTENARRLAVLSEAASISSEAKGLHIY